MERSSSRLRVLAFLVALMFVALTTRLWYLQVLASDTYKDTALQNSIRFVYTDPYRGLIVDASGTPLVLNQPSLEVQVTRDELGDEAEAVVLRLAELLDVPVADLRQSLQDVRYGPFQAVPVAEFVDEPAEPGHASRGQRVKLYIQEHPELFPGVSVESVAVRSYPFEAHAAHILGQVGLIEAGDYDRLKARGYGQNDMIGRAGLEVVYERWLRGTKGVQKLIVNADGEVIRALGSEPSQPGADVHLTLEMDEQRSVEDALSEGMERARSQVDSEGRPLRANAGAVVVMDADTGAIRAMASLPSFDPGWYVEGLTPEQSAYLSNGDLAPLVDRATQLGYAPGSSFKPVTGLVAVKEGVASLGGYYPCTSEYVHPNDESGAVFENWSVSNRTISIAEALRVSCDTVFYRFGSDFYFDYVNNQLGANGQVLQQRLREWGFGAPTGLDLPAEAPGLVPDAAYAEEHPDRYPYGWNPGGDILTMIGSGDLQATPLQMARAYSAIANGGHLCRPHLMERIETTDGRVLRNPGDRCSKTLPYSAGELSYIRNALATVVTSGTASCAFNGFPLSQVTVMGKTGTAERGSPDFQDTSWFAAMVGPVDHPDYVVVTMVEQGGFGGNVAAPITRDVIERLEGISPVDSPHFGCEVAEEEDG